VSIDTCKLLGVAKDDFEDGQVTHSGEAENLMYAVDCQLESTNTSTASGLARHPQLQYANQSQMTIIIQTFSLTWLARFNFTAPSGL
jgi:hypothetical protein